MKRILSLLLLLTALPAMAANWYVRKGATGSNNGTSWTNAWNEMSQISFSGVACGDTIWLAGGTTYTTGIDQATTKNCTSSAPLNIYRVQSTDSVPVAAAGWSSSFDSQVVIPNINIEGPAAYITISGRIPSGILIQIPGSSGDGIDAGVHSYAATNIDHITWTYIEVYGPACVTAGNCTGGGVIGVNVMPFCANTATWTNLLYDHLIVHRTGEAFRGCGQSGGIVQYSTIYQTANDGQQHEDILYSNPPYETMTWRYNKIFMSPNDGIFFEGTPGDANFALYGNMIYHSGGSLMTFKPESGSATYGPAFVYNNTFENDNQYGDYQPGWLDFNNMASGSKTQNNVFENIQSDNGTAPPGADYNAYSNGSSITKDSGAHSFTFNPGTLGSSVMFVNESPSNPIAADFHLTSTGKTTFASGATLAAPYNMDADGNTRGNSGAWTIGAYQTIATPTTVITPNESTIIQAAVKKIGINLNSPAVYSAGEMLKNLVWMDPGFEPDLQRQIMRANATTNTTTFQEFAPYNSDTTNEWAGAAFNVYRGAANTPICSGTIASGTAGANPTQTFSAACPSAMTLNSGGTADIMVMRKTSGCISAATWKSTHNQVQATGTVGIDCTTPLDGQESITLDGTSSTSSIQNAIETGSGNMYVVLNGTYHFSILAKALSGSPTVTFAAVRNSSGGGHANCTTSPVAVSSTAARVGADCTFSETSASGIGQVTVSFQVNGGKAEVDDEDLEKTSGLDSTNTSIFRDEVVAALRKLCGTNQSLSGVPCEIRDWAGNNWEEEANTVAPMYQRMPAIGQNTNGYDNLRVGLNDFLQLCQVVGAEPWWVVPMAGDESDGAKLAEFLGGASTTTEGAKRAALGQTAPWTSVFPKIHLELGNENWNGVGGGEKITFRGSPSPAPDTYYDYSMMAAGWKASMVSSSSWSAGSYDLILGFQDAGGYQADTALQRSGWNSGGLAPYTQNYHGDNDTLDHTWQGLYAEIYDNSHRTGSVFYSGYATINTRGKTNVYEMDNGTSGPAYSEVQGGGVGTTATQAQLDAFTDAAGYGVGAAMQGLEHLQMGVLDQNFFSLNQYCIGIGGLSPNSNGSGAPCVHQWGTNIDMGGATNAIRPQGLGQQIANAAIIGPMYSCGLTGATNTVLAANHNGYASSGTPAGNYPHELAYCFKAATGTARSMIVVENDVDNAHTIGFAGSQAPTGVVTVTRFAPSSISATNEATGSGSTIGAAQNVAISAPVTMTNPTTDTLPAHSVTRYDWGGSGSVTPPSAPTGFSGTFVITGNGTIH